MRIELDEQIRRAAGPPAAAPDVDVLVRRGRVWLRRRRMLVAGSVVAAVLVAGAGAQTVLERPTPPVLADSVPGVPQGPGSWAMLPRAPIAPRSEHAMVWTGREAIVWGGKDQLSIYADGAAFDPVDQTWRTLPPAPIPARAEHATVWTGSLMFVWGGDGGSPLADGAVYDPASDRWRELPEAPLAASRTPLATWTGSEVVVLAANDMRSMSYEPEWPAAAFDPQSWSWRLLEAAPILPAGFATITTADDRVIVLGGRHMGGLPGRGGPPPSEPLVGAVYDLSTGVWQAHEWPEMVHTSGAAAVWTGHQLLYFGGSGALTPTGTLSAYAPKDNRWEALPDGPMTGSLLAGVWTGAEMLIWGNTQPDQPQGAVYHASSNTWTPMTPSGLSRRSHPTAVWTGSQFIVWGGLHSDGGMHSGVADGAVYSPGVTKAASTTQPPRHDNPCFDPQSGIAAARNAGSLNQPVASYRTNDEALDTWLMDPPQGAIRTDQPRPEDGVDDGPAWLCWYDGHFVITAQDGSDSTVDRIAVVVQTDNSTAVVLGGQALGPNGGDLEAVSPTD